jgi:cytochrome c-type biogenesis protein CcmE
LKPRTRRLLIVGSVVAIVGVAAGLILNTFNSNLVFFFTPSQIVAREAPMGKSFRIGGMVEKGSLKRGNSMEMEFRVTDTAKTITVVYTGLLPDLFKEGKGVVARGHLLPDGRFEAEEVLAKHDENYMPPEAAEALKRAQSFKPDPGEMH